MKLRIRNVGNCRFYEVEGSRWWGEYNEREGYGFYAIDCSNDDLNWDDDIDFKAVYAHLIQAFNSQNGGAFEYYRITEIINEKRVVRVDTYPKESNHTLIIFDIEED